MTQPLIGVIPLWDDEKQSLWMLPGYLDGLREAGAIPLPLPLTTDARELLRLYGLCDGLLFTGGHDVNPAMYLEKPLPVCGAPCPSRDTMEQVLFTWALGDKKPVLGICRGLQLINVLLGGTLWQDLPSQLPSPLEHHMSAPYDRAVHTVTLVEKTPLRDALGQDTLGVNSYHHQGIRRLAPGLLPMAQAQDGLVEAVYHPEQPFLWAVQWHPEFSFRTDSASRTIFQAFVRAAASGSSGT